MAEAPTEPQVLLHEVSPNRNIIATVEQQRGVVYLYLHGRPETSFGQRACWVRNLRPAPAQLEEEVMRQGEPPLLPAGACGHPQGAQPLDPAALRIVWFEEGDAVALLERDQVLAVIPSWSGMEGFAGYARDCVAQHPLCWPLKEAEVILDRVAASEAFWKSWEKGHWPEVQDRFLGEYERVLGPHTRYYSIDEGKWPPKALARFEADNAIILLTLGVSIRLQPKVELFTEVPRALRRIELGMAFDRSIIQETVDHAAGFLGPQANLPWEQYSWLGHGHTIQCLPCPRGQGFEGVVLLNDPPGAPKLAMPQYRDDPVNLLWVTPLTAAERSFAEQQGTAELYKRLEQSGWLWPHRTRASAV